MPDNRPWPIKFFYGGFSLPVSFWFFFVGSVILSCVFYQLIFSNIFFSKIIEAIGFQGVKLVAFTMQSISFVWVFVLIVGVWRSAKNYTGPNYWASSVKFLIVINVIYLFVAMPKIFQNITLFSEQCDNNGISSFFPTEYDSNKLIEDKKNIRKLIYIDAINVLRVGVPSNNSAYLKLRNNNLSHKQIRKLFRSVLEVEKLSSSQIDEYFLFYDSSYRDGIPGKLNEKQKMVDALLN